MSQFVHILIWYLVTGVILRYFLSGIGSNLGIAWKCNVEWKVNSYEQIIREMLLMQKIYVYYLKLNNLESYSNKTSIMFIVIVFAL